MKFQTTLENFISEKKKWAAEVKPKKNSMHDILGIDPDQKISSHYKSGKALADALIAKVGRKKAASMINFAANVSSAEDIFDAAQKALSKKEDK